MTLIKSTKPGAGQNETIPPVEICTLGLRDYHPTWQAMLQFTEQRTADTADQIWIVEHPPVYTLGLAGKPEHLLNPQGIPVINTDRGGQVTYHGPGQLVVYLLLDLKRRQLGIKPLVQKIEQALIQLLADYQIQAHTIESAPGVYVDQKKIAALGLRVRRNGCYHGLSLNIDMDLSPFLGINPCGYPGLEVIQLHDLNPDCTLDSMQEIAQRLVQQLLAQLQTSSHNSFGNNTPESGSRS